LLPKLLRPIFLPQSMIEVSVQRPLELQNEIEGETVCNLDSIS
jgi:hypothetical protein